MGGAGLYTMLSLFVQKKKKKESLHVALSRMFTGR